jgi:hypothetical protein
MVAYERKLPPVDIGKAMTCQLHHLSAFAKQHELSLDWLMFGDLKGLQRTRVRRSRAILTVADVVTLYSELSMEDRRQISRRMAELLATAAADQS